MAHFAQLDENNIVVNVLSVADEDTAIDGVEDEATGVAFLRALLGDIKFVQTSYNNNIRTWYAGIGYSYDEVRDAFISPQPFPSWTLDEDMLLWKPPVPYPTVPVPTEEDDIGVPYDWDEATTSWVEVE